MRAGGKFRVRRQALRGKLLALKGAFGEAETAGREAVAAADGTDNLVLRGGALRDLAEFLSLADRSVEARIHLEQALELYDAKGDLASAGKTRQLLDSLAPARA
jgi:hypothetical protein